MPSILRAGREENEPMDGAEAVLLLEEGAGLVRVLRLNRPSARCPAPDRERV